jgi:hypothetical protein
MQLAIYASGGGRGRLLIRHASRVTCSLVFALKFPTPRRVVAPDVLVLYITLYVFKPNNSYILYCTEMWCTTIATIARALDRMISMTCHVCSMKVLSLHASLHAIQTRQMPS